MRDAVKNVLLWPAVVVVVAVAVVLVSGEKDEPAPAPAPAVVSGDSQAAPESGGPGGKRSGGGADGDRRRPSEPTGPDDADRTGAAPDVIRERVGRKAERTYRAYVAAINARDGEALCNLLAPGFLRELKPPLQRSGCAATMRASIGYEDPRRYPVWETTVLSGFESVTVEAGARRAQVTAAVITRFADRTEPSVESDIAYLGAEGGRMRLLKASGVLWRAVGKPDYPPSVISPP